VKLREPAGWNALKQLGER